MQKLIWYEIAFEKNHNKSVSQKLPITGGIRYFFYLAHVAISKEKSLKFYLKNLNLLEDCFIFLRNYSSIVQNGAINKIRANPFKLILTLEIYASPEIVRLEHFKGKITVAITGLGKVLHSFPKLN